MYVYDLVDKYLRSIDEINYQFLCSKVNVANSLINHLKANYEMVQLKKVKVINSFEIEE